MADKWMGKAFGKDPGALHRMMGVPEDKPLPMGRLIDMQRDLRAKKKRTAKESKLLKRVDLALRVKKGDLSVE